MVSDITISFYLKDTRICIYSAVLKGIGSPSRICFMISDNGDNLLVSPYEKKDLKSHRVPARVYAGEDSMRVNSYVLCHIIAELHGWDLTRSYRIPGEILPKKNVAVFFLKEAKVI